MLQIRTRLITVLMVALLPTMAVSATLSTTGGETAPVHLQLEAAAFAPEKLSVTVYLPPGYSAHSSRRYPVLYANDGQDMAAVGLQSTLAQLYRAHAISPLIVVAIRMLDDRASGYGLSDRANRRSVVGGSPIGPIGSKAQAYSEWVATALVPYVDAHYRSRPSPGSRTILGWSLGALNAFNLAWQYPDVFGRVGAFSPSFWLAADRTTAAAVQHTRLAQAMVDGSHKREGLRMWFAAGTTEEIKDRDGDGINDTIDDVQDLVQGYRDSSGFQQRGLKQLGYSIDMDAARHPSSDADVSLYLLPGGKHNQSAWGKMLPRFLRWAYGRQ